MTSIQTNYIVTLTYIHSSGGWHGGYDAATDRREVALNIAADCAHNANHIAIRKYINGGQPEIISTALHAQQGEGTAQVIAWIDRMKNLGWFDDARKAKAAQKFAACAAA